jgi:large subunit ribosomal protein L32
MAVPKKKTSKSKRNMRRSHHALNKINAVENATTGELTLPHHISLDGHYRGRDVFVAPAEVEEAELNAAETL